MARSFSDGLLEQVRAIPLATALESLQYHIAVDRDFAPVNDSQSKRWIVTSPSGWSSELVITGVKWYDTRAERGGGGPVDLVIHLERLSFVAAIKRLEGALRS